jgi:hypothetical protein
MGLAAPKIVGRAIAGRSLRSRVASSPRNPSSGGVAELQYNLFEREIAAELMPYCRREAPATLTFGALCCGLLSGKLHADVHFEGDDLRLTDPKLRPPRYIRALDSVKAFDDDSCTKSSRTTAAPTAIIKATRHAAIKTRMTFLRLPTTTYNACFESGSVKASVSIATKMRPTAPTHA